MYLVDVFAARDIPHHVLVRIAWIARRCSLLRYPVLENPELQLITDVPFYISPSESKEAVRGYTMVKMKSRLFSKRRGIARAKADLRLRQQLPSAYLWKIGLFLLGGHQFQRKADLSASYQLSGDLNLLRLETALLNTPDGRGGSMAEKRALSQGVTQRVIQCLFLDLLEFHYQVPFKVPIRRYLATGVPPGTRNDGKTDAIIRQYENELMQLAALSGGKEKSENLLALGKILRRRAAAAIPLAAQQQGWQKISAALNYAEKETEQLRQKREIQATIEATILFLNIFPDARKVRHCLTGEKDPTPNPQGIIRVLQDRTILPKHMFQQGADTKSSESNNVTGLTGTSGLLDSLQLALEAMQKEIATLVAFSESGAGDDDTKQAPQGHEQGSQGARQGYPAVDSLDPEPLFVLSCVAGQFTAEPSEIGIYTAGLVRPVAGPDQLQTGIEISPLPPARRRSTPSKPSDKQLVPDLQDWQDTGIVFLDPILELAGSLTGPLTQGEADWSLECWFFVPFDAGLENKSVASPRRAKDNANLSSDSDDDVVFGNRQEFGDTDRSLGGNFAPHQRNNTHESEIPTTGASLAPIPETLASGDSAFSHSHGLHQQYHSLCTAETGESLFSLNRTSGTFGIWCPGNALLDPQWFSFEAEGDLPHPIRLQDLEYPCWHFLTLTTHYQRVDASDPRSDVSVSQRFYIDGKLGGKITRNFPSVDGTSATFSQRHDHLGILINSTSPQHANGPPISKVPLSRPPVDLEIIGNNRAREHPFGRFSGFTVLSTALPSEVVLRRFHQRRSIAKRRAQLIRKTHGPF